MAEQLTGVNGSIIKWAREQYNMDLWTVASAVGVEIDRYQRWEQNEEHPTYAKLKKISSVLRKPSAVFFFPEPPVLPPLSGELRTLPNEVVNHFSRNIIIQFEKARVLQMSLQELYSYRASLLQEKSMLPTKLEDLAEYIRERMQFSISAQKVCRNTKVVFEIFREKLYDLGIYVFKDSFGDNSVSGLCVYDEHYPVIVINNAMSFARQIFTMFHELYHLISGTSGAEIIRDDYIVMLDSDQNRIESNCDTFANTFLVPIDDFQKEIQGSTITDEFIVELASRYSVSREAIMYKLWKMGEISSDDYSELKEQFYGEAIRSNEKTKKTNTGGGNYYSTQLAYLGRQYTGEVFKQYFSGKIDNVRAGQMLQSKVDHLPNLERAYYRGMK